uniref:Uncharacterized protein n=1 Tax=Globodera rostochiensis TaxID=31243 RepID=A0A914HC28_GLORO
MKEGGTKCVAEFSRPKFANESKEGDSILVFDRAPDGQLIAEEEDINDWGETIHSAAPPSTRRIPRGQKRKKRKPKRK